MENECACRSFIVDNALIEKEYSELGGHDYEVNISGYCPLCGKRHHQRSTFGGIGFRDPIFLEQNKNRYKFIGCGDFEIRYDLNIKFMNDTQYQEYLYSIKAKKLELKLKSRF